MGELGSGRQAGDAGSNDKARRVLAISGCRGSGVVPRVCAPLATVSHPSGDGHSAGGVASDVFAGVVGGRRALAGGANAFAERAGLARQGRASVAPAGNAAGGWATAGVPTKGACVPVASASASDG